MSNKRLMSNVSFTHTASTPLVSVIHTKQATAGYASYFTLRTFDIVNIMLYDQKLRSIISQPKGLRALGSSH